MRHRILEEFKAISNVDLFGYLQIYYSFVVLNFSNAQYVFGHIFEECVPSGLG